ncbi:hypothetical protein Pcinc_011545 [Petrolisthes cinctipes]|uniref:Uncharacterized protein n=1 Tax=Petrolisthes cinctipes TaxID=88211 RepID=A0AAE1G141_PETCI|nr:hypothetical protein Pcinc_011545 [Petrolisthes cinctipes]
MTPAAASEDYLGGQAEAQGWSVTKAVRMGRGLAGMQSGWEEVGVACSQEEKRSGWQSEWVGGYPDDVPKRPPSLLSQPRMKPVSITDNSMKRPQHPARTNPSASQPTTTKIIIPVTTINSSTITSPITTT